jgi:hypothetical protein
MKCETARRRLPEPSADQHVASCAACMEWIQRVDRAREMVSVSFPPAPQGLIPGVLAASSAPVAEPRPQSVSPPGRGSRKRTPVRALAVAASVLLVAAGAALWVVSSSERPAEALSVAAAATKEAESARFTFQGDFSVRLRLPPGALEGLTREADEVLRSAERAIAPPGFPRELRKGLERQLDLRRDWLFELAEPIATAIPSFSPEVRVQVGGDGEFAARDAIRIDAELQVREPATASGAFEFVRVGDDVFLKLETTGWRAVAGLPIRVLRPVASGLSSLADWVADDAERARFIGRETVDGRETARYRLGLPARGEGVRNIADVWVGADDNLVHRLRVRHAVNRAFAQISGTVDVRLFDHGADLEVEIPKGAILEEDPKFAPEIGLRLDEIDVWLGAGLPGPPE